MNAENENGTRQGAALKTDYDTTNVTEASLKVNGIAQPPAGNAWENGEVVPTTLPPQEWEPLTELGALLRTISEAVTWSDGHPVKWTAFCVVIGRDERSTADIAEHLGVSQRTVQLHVDAAKKWLDELRLELGRAVPSTGATNK